jgi:hypothetical protein
LTTNTTSPAATVPTVSTTDSASEGTAQRGYQLEILLVSFAALLLEISYTRVVSFKLYYYYVYLIIGLALLGIGAGGVLVAVSARIRRTSTDVILLWCLLLGSASVGIGYLVVALTTIDTLAIWDYGTWASVTNLLRLVAICLALFAPFIAVGVVLATLFGRGAERIGRLYFADLVGAGLACAVVVSLLTWIGPPATIALAGLVFAVAGIRIATRVSRRVIPAVLAVAAILAVIVAAPDLLPEQRTEAGKFSTVEESTEYSSWSPLFRVDVQDFTEFSGSKLLLHDGLFGSAIYEFDGDVSGLTRFDTDPRSLPYATSDEPYERVLIIGAAGGNEILASLYFGSDEIDAVELNPVTYDLVTDRYAEYAGNIAEHPKVNYINDEGRSYLARSDEPYDLIWYPAPDSYSAANAATAGAFVLSESYLYTSEAVVESLEHLSPNGLLAVQFGEFAIDGNPTRTTRYVSTARHALNELGIDDPSDHILVVNTDAERFADLSTILVKREPFTDAEVDGVIASLEDLRPLTEVSYAPGNPIDGNPATIVATADEDTLDDFYANYPASVGPITDDGPFFWHFKPFGDVIRNFGDPVDPTDPEDTVGERVLLLLLLIAVVLASVFLLLPFVLIRNVWSALPRKGVSAIYFLCLGLGFIFFEIVLIQRLTLFLGYPTYSLTVTLASILLFTGVGALLSGRYQHHRQRALPVLVVVLVVLTLFYQFALPELTDGWLAWPLAARISVAFLVLAPLGICLGTFMPFGLGAVAGITEFPREYVAWGWAVNGFSSVIGAVLATILAMSFGFRVVLFLALIAYLVALLALRSLLRTKGPTPLPV